MEYTADDVKIINWPEPVRKRLSMYYKHLGNEGCFWLIEEILESILNEKYLCKASYVEVRYTRHREVVIEYNGKGIPVDVSSDGGIPEPVIYRTLMSLFGGKLTEEDIRKYGHLIEVGSIFNAACKMLRIYCVSENKSYSVSFYQGCISSPLSESSNYSALTKLQFQLDSSVLGDFAISEHMLKSITDNMQSRYRGAEVKYVG